MAKNDYKGKLESLETLKEILSSSKYGYSVRELEEKMGVSYRTIYRWINILDNAGHFVCAVKRHTDCSRGRSTASFFYIKPSENSSDPYMILVNEIERLSKLVEKRDDEIQNLKHILYPQGAKSKVSA